MNWVEYNRAERLRLEIIRDRNRREKTTQLILWLASVLFGVSILMMGLVLSRSA